MANVKIKVRSKPYYKGTKTLDGNVYLLTFRWNTFTSKWYMDILGLNSTSVDIKGIALLPGKDLITLHGYEELGQLWLIDNQDGPGQNPTYENMGSRWTLEYIPKSDL